MTPIVLIKMIQDMLTKDLDFSSSLFSYDSLCCHPEEEKPDMETVPEDSILRTLL